MTLRGRLVALAALVAVLLAGIVVVLVRSQTAGCSVAAPRPSLAPALRALGDFDQAYDAGDVAGLDDVATRAAAALYGDLIGVTAEAPVAVAAEAPGSPDALVVPLRSHTAPVEGTVPLAGLVVFLRDCQGRAYFSTVEDDSSARPPILAFPAVGHDQAAAALGSAALRLSYATSPLHPRWVTTAPPARSLPAR